MLVLRESVSLVCCAVTDIVEILMPVCLIQVLCQPKQIPPAKLISALALPVLCSRENAPCNSSTPLCWFLLIDDTVIDWMSLALPKYSLSLICVVPYARVVGHGLKLPSLGSVGAVCRGYFVVRFLRVSPGANLASRLGLWCFWCHHVSPVNKKRLCFAAARLASATLHPRTDGWTGQQAS